MHFSILDLAYLSLALVLKLLQISKSRNLDQYQKIEINL